MVDKNVLYLSLLAAVGLVFAAILTYLVYKLWRYIRTSKEGDRKISTLDKFPTNQHNVPISYSPVPVQESEQFEYTKDVYAQGKKREQLPATSKWRSINILKEVKKTKAFEPPKQLDSWKLEIEATKQSQRAKDDSVTDSSPDRINSLTVEPFAERPKRVSVSQMPKQSLEPQNSLEMVDSPFQKMLLKPITEGDHPVKSKSRKAVDLRGQSIKEEMFLNVSEGEGSMTDTMSMSSSIHEDDEILQRREAGNVRFAARYSERDKKLQVRIISASEIAPDRRVEEIKPFVRLSLYPGKKRSQNTKVMKEPSKTPTYNETIVFHGLTLLDIGTFKLKLKVCNYIRVGKRETLGETELVLNNLTKDNTENEFSLPLVEILREDTPKISLNMSVNHEFSAVKLSATIHNAHMPKLKRSKLDSYVEIELYDHEKLIDKKHTSAKKNTLMPIFEETLSIPLTLSNPDDLKDYHLHVKLLHTTLTGKIKNLGHLLLSLSSTIQSGKDHWEKVIEKPDVNVKETHLIPMAHR